MNAESRPQAAPDHAPRTVAAAAEHVRRRSHAGLTALPIGERVPYAVAGRAARQAVDRAVELGDVVTRADWQVLSAVLYATSTYSRLVDRWPLEETDLMPNTRPLPDVAGVSERQARRSLSKLAKHGIVVYIPGRGAGNITVIGVPAEGQKADEHLAALGSAKSGQSGAQKADSAGSEKRPPTRARVRTEKTFREDDREESAPHTLEGEVVDAWTDAYQAVADATDADPSLEAGAIAAATKAILAAHRAEHDTEAGVAAEIRHRAQRYRHAWPRMALTPTALATHWRRIPNLPTTGGRGGGMTGTEALRWAEERRQHKRAPALLDVEEPYGGNEEAA